MSTTTNENEGSEDEIEYIKKNVKEIGLTLNPSMLAFQLHLIKDTDKIVYVGPHVNHNYFKSEKGYSLMNSMLDDVLGIKPINEKRIKNDMRFFLYYSSKVSSNICQLSTI